MYIKYTFIILYIHYTLIYYISIVYLLCCSSDPTGLRVITTVIWSDMGCDIIYKVEPVPRPPQLLRHLDAAHY